MSNIYVDDLGEGFPFVLVHGYLGSSEMWTFQKEFFSKDYRVITPALPGFGESHNVKSLDSINKMAKEIINVLDQKKIDKFNLIGHSMGGMIVQEITKLIGDRVNKLICFATGSIGDIPGRFETMDETREKLKKDGTKISFSRVPPKWFVKGKKDENYYLFKEFSFKNFKESQKFVNKVDTLKKNIKNSRLEIFKDCAHNVHLEQPDQFNNLVKEFISK